MLRKRCSQCLDHDETFPHTALEKECLPLIFSFQWSALDNTSVAWSAALRFAPRKSVTQQKKRPTVAAALLASSSSMESMHVESKTLEKSVGPVNVEAEESSSSSTSKPSAGPSREALQGIKTAALSLTDSAGAQKDFSMLPIITQPPEMAIPPDELEKDRAIFAELAEKRGERKRPDFEDVDDEDDGDVNGWSNTKEGKRAKKKVSDSLSLRSQNLAEAVSLVRRSTRGKGVLLQAYKAQ